MYFLELVLILTADHPRKLQPTVYRGVCRIFGLAGASEEPHLFRASKTIVGGLHAKEWLSVAELLQHFFPLLCTTLRTRTPRLGKPGASARDREAVRDMLRVLLVAFYLVVHASGVKSEVLRVPEGWANFRVWLAPKEASQLVAIMVDAKLPKTLLWGLAGTPFEDDMLEVCLGMALAGVDQSVRIRKKLADALVPLLLRAIYVQDGILDEVRKRYRQKILFALTRQPFRDDDRELAFHVSSQLIGEGAQSLTYEWEDNVWALSEGLFANATEELRASKLVQIRLDGKFLTVRREGVTSIPVAPQTSAQKSEVCVVCCVRSEISKRCSRCRARYCCSVDCQRKDWPSHKGSCIQT